MIGNIFNTLVFQPILNFLIGLYALVGDFGITIIIVTLVLKLVLFPINKKGYQSQRQFAKVQPRIKELQEKYKDDKQKLAVETMALYKELKVQPFGFFLPFIAQIIVLIALYRVIFLTVKDGFHQLLYTFVPKIDHISLSFLGFVDLSKTNIPLAVLAAVSQFYSSKLMMQKTQSMNPAPKPGEEPNIGQTVGKQMMYITPFFTLLVGLQFPGALVFYWFVMTLFNIVEIQIIYKHLAQDEAKSLNASV